MCSLHMLPYLCLCMSMHMHVQSSVHMSRQYSIYFPTHLHTYAYTYTCLYSCLFAYTHLFVPMSRHVFNADSTNACASVYTHVYTHVYTLVCAQVHTNVNKHVCTLILCRYSMPNAMSSRIVQRMLASTCRRISLLNLPFGRTQRPVAEFTTVPAGIS